MPIEIFDYFDFIEKVGDIKSLVSPPDYDIIVEKDQCFYCFDNDLDDGGLFICLKTWKAYCLRHLSLTVAKSVPRLFLVIERNKHVIDMADFIQRAEFDAPKDTYKYSLAFISVDLVVFKTAYISKGLDEHLETAAKYVIYSESSRMQHALKLWTKKMLPISRHGDKLNLSSLVKKVPDRKDWKCEECGLTENLWMNLSDGKILCGRKQYGGLDGNCHALIYYKETGFLNPLVVKLGTISPTGADVFSYEEDELVTIPHLGTHLRRFGIEMAKCCPTEKITQLVELENNLKAMRQSTDIVGLLSSQGTEGKLFLGLKNLGNSCYMNSILRLFCCVKEFTEIFAVDPAIAFLTNMEDLTDDIVFQLMKVIYHLEDKSAIARMLGKEPSQNEIEPYELKNALCKNNVTFLGTEQQDASEFLFYFFEEFQKYSQKYSCPEFNIRTLFTFKYHAIQVPANEFCSSELQVVESDEIMLQIPVVGGEQTIGPSQVPWINNILNGSIVCKNENEFYMMMNKLKTYPKYLLVQLNRFWLGPDYELVKSNDDVEMPLLIDLTDLNYTMDATILHSELQSSKKQQNLEISRQLTEMGFDSKKAMAASYNCTTLDQAISWIFENEGTQDDEDVIPTTDGNLTDFVRYDEPLIQGKQVKYQMKGFINHEGVSTQFGHYVTYVRKSEDWYVFDDSLVFQSPLPPTNKGYIYLYERMN